jgi:pimeloyl-ACP methyl ester carboxylesterase
MLDGPLAAGERARLDALASPERDVVLGVWGSVFDSTPSELDAAVSALLAGVRVPYLAIHGSDPGPAYGEWLRARVPAARLEVWPDHGHYPQLVDPGRFVARLEAFDAAG